MLDDLFPVQFIEGINENAKADERQYINTMGYSSVALKYKPNTTYSLTGLHIVLIAADVKEEEKVYKFTLRTNYMDNPSDNVLTEGELVSNPECLNGWTEIKLRKPLVVIRGKDYWCTLELEDKRIGLPFAVGKEIVDSDLRFYTRNGWIIEERFPISSVMVRFYGRLIPVIN